MADNTNKRKPSAILVIRDRNTIALPPMQLGSFHKLLEFDSYEGKDRFKARFHLNPAGIEALVAQVDLKCVTAHFDAMKKQVDEWAADAKEDGKQPPIKLCKDASGAQSGREFVEDKLKDPQPKDKVQLPTIQLHVDAYRPLRKGQDEADRELRDILFWDAKGKLLDRAALKKMTAGTWCQPVVHPNLFLSKQLGPSPRPQLQLVGLQIIKLVEFGSGGSQEQAPDAADDAEMRRIMGDDYSAADDLASMGVGSSRDAESGLELPDDSSDSPF